MAANLTSESVTPSLPGADLAGSVAPSPPGVRGEAGASCGAGRYRLLGRCYRRKGAGTLCLSSSWCRSGRCRRGLCQRGRLAPSGDCRSGRPACACGEQCVQLSPDSSWQCRRPTVPDGSVALGATCSKASECASTVCSGGICGCPDDFTACAGRCYKAGPSMPRNIAEDMCRSEDAILATPRSLEDNVCVLSVAAALNAGGSVMFWLGFLRPDHSSPFVGADGTEMTYTNWILPPEDDDDINAVVLLNITPDLCGPAGGWYGASDIGGDPVVGAVCQRG